MAQPPRYQRISLTNSEKSDNIAKAVDVFAMDTISALDRNLTFKENFRGQVATIRVIGGQSTLLPLTMQSPPTGVWIVNIKNLSDPTEILTNAPFPQWEMTNKNELKLKTVTGLTASETYEINLLIIAG
jgi:hypothetical protein